MNLRTMLALGAALVATPALAQETTEAVSKTSDQIVCELAGTCGDAAAPAAVGAEAAAPADGAVPAPAPRARVSAATRGFAIARPVGAQVPAPGARPTMAPSRPAAQLAASGHSSAQIAFMPGSASLTGLGKQQALQFLNALKNPLLAQKRFEVIGHTDASGNAATNLKLSQARAQSVVDYLVANGADKTKLAARGMGSQKLLDTANPTSPANRRVEFVRVN